MNITLDSENVFKVKLYDALEFGSPSQYDYLFTPKYCSYDIIVREKKLFTQIYIEHKERNVNYLHYIRENGLMFNKCKLNYYQKYLSGSFIIIATTIDDTSYWTMYEPTMNDLPTLERNQPVVFLPFHTFSDDMEALATHILNYFR